MSEVRISQIVGRRVWDSRGRPTVEAEIILDNGAMGRAIAPAGASTGTHEAIELRDGGPAFGGFGVDRAVANVNGEIVMPDAPGLGIEINPNTLARYKVDVEIKVNGRTIFSTPSI